MGFFGENGSLGKDFPVAEDGSYTCRLKEILPVEGKVFKEGEAPKPQFRWNFVALEVTDPEGEPFKFSTFTGREYGFDGAFLTKLLDSMLERRLTPEEFTNLDLEDLTPRKWKVLVSIEKNKQGKEFNKIVSVKPIKATPSRVITAQRPTPPAVPGREPVDPDGLEDPFDTDPA